MVLRASFQLNISISGSQLSGLPQGKGTTFPRQKQEKTAFCVVNRALKSYYIGTQRGGGGESVRVAQTFSFFLRLKNNCPRVWKPHGHFSASKLSGGASRTDVFFLFRLKYSLIISYQGKVPPYIFLT